MKGCECQSKCFGLCLGGNREPLKIPGHGIAMIREGFSEDSSGQLSQNGLKSEHSKGDKQGLCRQGPE